MSEAAVFAISFEDFLELEHGADVRHEYVGGRIYAVSGGTERHDLVGGLLYQAIVGPAQEKGCRTFIANRLLRTPSNSAYCPDIMVVCGMAADPQYERDAALIVEVLSRSTAGIDRREKALAYFESPTLRQYLLVDPQWPKIEVAVSTPGGLIWRVYG
ncbi:MAG: Uma2 family endonuclease, partial [Acidimicrobiales bacterium]